MEGRQEFIRDSWRLHPVLKVPEPFPPAVMFTIRDSNPHSQYIDAQQKFSKQGMSHRTYGLAWDSTFRDVAGDKMGLLYRNEGRQQGTSQVAVHMVMISSTEPEGTKWLVTRATEFQGKSVCWCVPVEVQKGKRTDVSLSTENMTILERS